MPPAAAGSPPVPGDARHEAGFVTSPGWIHLILGVVVFAAGVGLPAGQTWARVVGVVLAVISAVENFLFLPYYPFWAIFVIAVDLMIIWALLVYGRVIGSHEA